MIDDDIPDVTVSSYTSQSQRRRMGVTQEWRHEIASLLPSLPTYLTPVLPASSPPSTTTTSCTSSRDQQTLAKAKFIINQLNLIWTS